jgi:hypothetical protein
MRNDLAIYLEGVHVPEIFVHYSAHANSLFLQKFPVLTKRYTEA